MITKQDITKLKEIFVTKAEFHEFKNDAFGKLDIVIGELKAIREEQTVGAYRFFP